MTQYEECYSSNKYRDAVVKDGQDALAAGVQGTPSFVLTYTNASGEEITELIEGAQPFSVFQEKIEAALAAASQ